MEITEFKKGDQVVRTEPSKSLGTMIGLMGELVEQRVDRSYIGDRLEFLGCANGIAYFNQVDNDSFEHQQSGVKVGLPMGEFSEGWEMYVDVENDNTHNTSFVKASLKDEVQKMIDNEDYESLNELKNMFDSIIKNQ